MIMAAFRYPFINISVILLVFLLTVLFEGRKELAETQEVKELDFANVPELSSKNLMESSVSDEVSKDIQSGTFEQSNSIGVTLDIACDICENMVIYCAWCPVK